MDEKTYFQFSLSHFIIENRDLRPKGGGDSQLDWLLLLHEARGGNGPWT
jgi:hypothetical protein